VAKALTSYIGFIIACAFVIVAFITSRTYMQLGIAILLYPILVFFAYKIIPQRAFRTTIKKSVKKESTTVQTQDPTIDNENIKIGISDIDKRVFLKLIGSTSIVLFILSIFNKRAENVFFKNFSGIGNTPYQSTAINNNETSTNQPLDGYRITEFDDNINSFYGFTNKDGGWYIMKLDTASGSFRYSKGDSNFPASWDNRDKLKYDYFNNVF
jgi:hypothetical protein